MRILLLCLLVFLTGCEKQAKDKEQSYVTPFEASNGLQTATYQETIDFYMELARDFPEINIQTIGETDSEYPLHIVTFNADADFNFQKLAPNKTIVLVNNGIHPGESDGIDASMMLFRDLAQNTIEPPENVVLVAIPVYNIGGALNRGMLTRVNQNGPEEYGFRGNARNYDLNRDFIKSDTRNTRTFAKIYQLLQPDFFVDTHVSNGADYQYSISHLFTQHNKLGGEPGGYLEDNVRPEMERKMEEAGWPITPYVNIFNTPPDNGFSQFMDHPRYSTGYTSLWNSFGVMIETHMLKPYEDRVHATYEFLKTLIGYCDSDHQTIKSIREEARNRHKEWLYYPVKWGLDSTRVRKLNFKGYQADTLISAITGLERLKYNRQNPFIREVPYYNYYKPTDSVEIPEAYVIGSEWQRIIDRLELNGIVFSPLENDTLMRVQSAKITNYKTYQHPYEGHYPHYDTELEYSFIDKRFSAGDFLIPTDQPGIRYLLETLEAQAIDSFFNWNFFDTVLQQKEGFSPYVFEDLALQILHSNPVLKDSLELKKERDPVFSENWYAQLQWLYERSEYFEQALNQYPVYKILKDQSSPEDSSVTK